MAQPPVYFSPIKIHLSDRRIPLVYCGNSIDVPILTIENYLKWYCFYLIHPDNMVEAVPFKMFKDVNFPDTEWFDHVPNPEFAVALADHYKWALCSQSLDMIIGRFEKEVMGRNPDSGLRRYHVIN